MHKVLRDVLKAEYNLLLSCPFLRRDSVHCVVAKEFGSKTVERDDLKAVIDEQWNNIRVQKPFLFNQSKFRYYRSTLDKSVVPTCTVELGLTDYKAYVGSNLGGKWQLFEEEGKKIGNQDSFFSNPLGNICLLVLRDGRHVIINRSFNVAEGQGKLTCVGGHPEPSNIGISDYADMDHVSTETVKTELFDSMIREVYEEANIPVDKLSDMCMIGVISCNKTHGREVQVFCCFVDMTIEEVLKQYTKGPIDQYESVGINFLLLDDVITKMNNDADGFVPEVRAAYGILLSIYDDYLREFDSFQLKCHERV